MFLGKKKFPTHKLHLPRISLFLNICGLYPLSKKMDGFFKKNCTRLHIIHLKNKRAHFFWLLTAHKHKLHIQISRHHSFFLHIFIYFPSFLYMTYSNRFVNQLLVIWISMILWYQLLSPYHISHYFSCQ